MTTLTDEVMYTFIVGTTIYKNYTRDPVKPNFENHRVVCEWVFTIMTQVGCLRREMFRAARSGIYHSWYVYRGTLS